jgi:hypothetical protein
LYQPESGAEPVKKGGVLFRTGTKRKLLMLGKYSRQLPGDLVELILTKVENSVHLEEAAGNGRDI